ncbi:MAG: cbb3-type cytochrome c oxidase N-terminal domain-containing protein [Desulfobulbales bacterium]|nr:cbb3-type cytochrome c oxidase N-terminal domain-containing protein [Desulfobulbales bacterium]
MTEQRIDPNDGIREEPNKPPVYFNVLYYGTILWAVVFCAYYLLSGWSSHGEFKEEMSAYEQEYSAGQASGL